MSFGWVICIVLGGIAGVLDAREKITGRPVRLRFRRFRRRPALDDPEAAAGAGANSAVNANAAIGAAWASASARRWLAVYGAELGALDGFAKIGGLSCFRCPGQNYLSFSDVVSKETVTGTPDQAAGLLADLFLSLGFVPDGCEVRRAEVAEVAAVPSEDMPDGSAEDMPDGWDNDFYRDQTRAAWASGVDLEEPQTLLEVVANAFKGKKHFLDRADFERETGYQSELNKYAAFWTKAGGLSLVAWSELIASDYSYTGLIPCADGGGYDIQAVRDAVIDLFAICSKPSEINTFTRDENRRRLENLEGLF